MNLASSLAVIAPALSLSSGIPAVVRPVRARTIDGLSEATIVAGITGTMMWGTYGFLMRDPSQLATNVPMFVLRSALVAFAFLMCARRGRFAAMFAVAVAATAVAGLAGAVTVGLVASTLGLVQQLPQLAHTLRHGRGPGLSVGSLALGVISSAVWTAYGLTHADTIVAACSATICTITALLLAAAVTPAGAMLHAGRRTAVRVAHADMVALRRCRRVAPQATRAAAEFFPTFAQAARNRHQAYGARMERHQRAAVTTA